MKIEVIITDEAGKIHQYEVSNSPLLDDKELKRLIWEDWEGEIKEDPPLDTVFKYMKMMRNVFIKE